MGNQLTQECRGAGTHHVERGLNPNICFGTQNNANLTSTIVTVPGLFLSYFLQTVSHGHTCTYLLKAPGKPCSCGWHSHSDALGRGNHNAQVILYRIINPERWRQLLGICFVNVNKILIQVAQLLRFQNAHCPGAGLCATDHHFLSWKWTSWPLRTVKPVAVKGDGFHLTAVSSSSGLMENFINDIPLV